MTKIINIGMNHETAPVEVRECLAAEPENVKKAISFMRDNDAIKEGFFLSTCNRVETLFTTECVEEANEGIINFLSELGGIPKENFLSNLYIFEEMDAVNHIFNVASSLDSMIVGEPQILGQIKDAYAIASKERTAGVILNRLMHRAFHVAKRVRTETGISGAAVSISYAAVELAKKIFYNLDGKKVLLIGAGEMAELAARHLMRQGVSSMAVANRTFERAVQVAELFHATPVSFDEIGTQLTEVDIVIASTASPGYVVTRDQVRTSIKKRRNRALFFIDIAVPRDIEPEINDLNNVYLYDIDDLKGVIELNMAQRKEEAVRAQSIVMEEVVKFESWLKTLSVVPTIVSLRDKAESIVQAELKRSASALAEITSEQKEVVKILARSIVEKIINDPILVLKRNADRPNLDTYLDMTKKLFSLDNSGDNTN